MTRRCCCLWPEGFTLPWPKVMWPRSRSINTFLIVYCTWSPAYLLDHQHIYVSLWSSAYLCISLSTGRDIFFLPLHPSVPAYGISSDHLFVVYQKVTKFLITYITYRAKVWWCPNKLLTFFFVPWKKNVKIWQLLYIETVRRVTGSFVPRFFVWDLSYLLLGSFVQVAEKNDMFLL